MHVFARERSIRYLSPLFAVVSPEKANDIARQLRSLVYPEDRYDALRYVNKAKAMFEKMRNIDIRVRTL